MSDLERIRDSTDEGELSEGSEPRSASPKQQKKRHEKEKEGRGEKRKRLADRITFSSGQHSDDESVEMFTIQPGDSKAKNYEKERKEKEKEKEKHKHKHERKEERRDREKDGEEKERHRSKHEERHRRHEERREEREKERGKDRERKDRDREKDRERREKKNRDGRDSGRKHRRSDSSSDDVPMKKDKREKKSSESKEKKEPGTLFNTKDRPAKSTEVQEIEHTPPSEHPMEVDESMVIRDTGDIASFTLDSPAGPKKYSKFDSSPEHDPEDQSPIHSDVEIIHSDAEEEDTQENVDDDPGFDVENAVWEELTDEQKASLTPDSKKRLEGDWQQRLVDQLPVFYPGIMGCRNVQEFHCENRIEEGTYGIVFRAKDKRTDEIVALKRLKMEKEREGFPITSLREINMLLKAGNHPNIVNVKEVVIGSNMDKIYVVMDFVEHDLKSLMETMKARGKSFTVGVQKGLMKQLLSGLKHMHDLWILHRDLKSSNLLLSHKGILKIADFGLAREFGSPLKQYTPIVVTLWYRAPELLLGTKLYSTPIDMWSVGCLMAEFVLQKPLFPGKSEIDEIGKIFLELGTPNERVWPGYESLPLVKQCSLPQHPHNQLRKKFPGNLLHPSGFQLLNAFLRYDPSKRFTAQEGLEHEWFREEPLPTPPEMFPTFPAKSELHKAPPPSHRPQQQKPEVVVNAATAKLMQDLNVRPEKMRNTEFSLKFMKY